VVLNGTINFYFRDIIAQELIDEGYVASEAIQDHAGRPFETDPAGKFTFQWSVVSKSCGKSGCRVSLSSKVGDSCPCCGVRWSSERQENR